MIDLTKDLPDTIEVDGKSYLIKTDFRDWLEFSQLVESGKDVTLQDVVYLFVDEIPQTDFSQQLVDFFTNPNEVPNYRGGNNERVLDYLIDSEYIYASFMAEYGIDLCDVKLHWWKFKALLIGLNDESKLKQIMSMRTYTKSNKDPHKIAMENKKAWALPRRTKKQEEEIEDALEKIFFGC